MKLCSLNLAKTLQELNYDGEYSAWIDRDDGVVETDSHYIYNCHIPCPRLDDVTEWLREKHKLHVQIIECTWLTSKKVVWLNFIVELVTYCTLGHEWQNFCDTYDEALEEGVRKAIEIIKEKEK